MSNPDPEPLKCLSEGGPYCIECGDCIACHGDDPCFDGGSHDWFHEEAVAS